MIEFCCCGKIKKIYDVKYGKNGVPFVYFTIEVHSPFYSPKMQGFVISTYDMSFLGDNVYKFVDMFQEEDFVYVTGKIIGRRKGDYINLTLSVDSVIKDDIIVSNKKSHYQQE